MFPIIATIWMVATTAILAKALTAGIREKLRHAALRRELKRFISVDQVYDEIEIMKEPSERMEEFWRQRELAQGALLAMFNKPGFDRLYELVKYFGFLPDKPGSYVSAVFVS